MRRGGLCLADLTRKLSFFLASDNGAIVFSEIQRLSYGPSIHLLAHNFYSDNDKGSGANQVIQAEPVLAT
jgi:hypothetical protein